MNLYAEVQFTELEKSGVIKRDLQGTIIGANLTNRQKIANARLVRLSCAADNNPDYPPKVLWEKRLDPVMMAGESRESVAPRVPWSSFSRRCRLGFGWIPGDIDDAIRRS